METTTQAKLAGVKVGDWVYEDSGRSYQVEKVTAKQVYVGWFWIDIATGRSVGQAMRTSFRLATEDEAREA